MELPKSKLFKSALRGLGAALVRAGNVLLQVRGNYAITKPTDPSNVEILGDPAFQASVREVSSLTLLDTARLANLWALCRATDPRGNILEIGCYRGGGALHLSNACPNRKVIACDSFKGFETLHPNLDRSFDRDMFLRTSKASVEALFSSRGRTSEVLEGFFPASAAGRDLRPVSFVHLDVDIYKATIDSLRYLEEERILTERPLIVLDDFHRKAEGVDQAVREFTARHQHWACFPLFPGQGLLLHANWLACQPAGRGPRPA